MEYNFNVGKSFNIGQILECGQCFNFVKIEDNYYKLTAFNKVLYVKQQGDNVTLFPCTKDDFDNIWSHYFDLTRDYDSIKEVLRHDNVLNKAIPYGEGIRILNQEHFECLISFIISQNNRIPMIKNVIKNLSETYGEKIDDGFSFPTAEVLQSVEQEKLRECKTGFRDKYILDASSKVYNNEINLTEIEKLKTNDLSEKLMEIKGVGVKVANCVTLFSYGRGDSFPVDVWIKRAVETLYFDGEQKSKDYIKKFGEDKFMENSGLAQQYLFNYALNGNLKI